MKIICIGRNYVNHAKELNNPVPKQPLIFMKPDTAMLVNRKPFFYPEFTEKLHYEAEIVLKVCKNGKHVEPKFAHKYYDQLTVGLDLTARDVQARCKEKGHPWEIAKGFDGSAVLGEFISMADFQADNIDFSLNKNGETVQKGNTKDLIFSFDYIISYVSKFFRLHIGDMIFTGTPEGVGPLQVGDELEGFIGEKRLLECRIK